MKLAIFFLGLSVLCSSSLTMTMDQSEIAEKLECVVCCFIVATEDQAKTLDCSHGPNVHQACLDRWYQTTNPSFDCPCCRNGQRSTPANGPSTQMPPQNFVGPVLPRQQTDEARLVDLEFLQSRRGRAAARGASPDTLAAFDAALRKRH